MIPWSRTSGAKRWRVARASFGDSIWPRPVRPRSNSHTLLYSRPFLQASEWHAGHGILWQYPPVHLKWLEMFTCENCKIQGAIGLNFQIFRRLISSAPRAAHSLQITIFTNHNNKPIRTLPTLPTLHLHSKIIQKSVWRHGHGRNHGMEVYGTKTTRYWRESPAADAILSCILKLHYLA